MYILSSLPLGERNLAIHLLLPALQPPRGELPPLYVSAWQSRGQSIVQVVADYLVRARKSIVDYAFHLTITDPTETILDEELPALVAAGNRSIKIFMTYKGLGLSDRQILNVLDAARRYKALVCVHAENDALIEYMTEKLLKAGLTRPKYFPWAKPIVAEREAVHRIIALSEALDVPIEVFHVSGEESAAEIERAQRRGLKVWAETCPQYLTLLADDLDQPGFEGAKFIFGPPARTIADQEALWNYIRRGVISVISSDHSAIRFNSRKGKKIGGDDAPLLQCPTAFLDWPHAFRWCFRRAYRLDELVFQDSLN